MRLALVHDWLNQIGGAEDVLDTLVGLYPNSPVFTSIHWSDSRMPKKWTEWDIRKLWIDRLPGIHRWQQAYFMMYPLAWQGLDLSDYDLVLSNKSGFCHGFRSGRETTHICYCLAPTRYVWQFDQYMARENVPSPVRSLIRPFLPKLRSWDYKAAQRVDHFVAISTDIQHRIKQYYNRDSEIIFPPVEAAERFVPSSTVEDYFLSVGRLIPYKRLDLLVQACTRLDLPLKIAGTGRDLEKLKQMAGPTVDFLGYVPDEDLPGLYARAKAFVFPGLEDFGITPVQAQAAGRPVIAFKGGGALDTVIPGVTGEFFSEQTVESLMGVLEDFDPARYHPDRCRQHALSFDTSVFTHKLQAYIDRVMDRPEVASK